MSLFSDIVDLAKAGWKPSDVKAILAMDQKNEESAKNENQDLIPKSKSEEKKEAKKEAPEIDYKAKYEEAQKKLNEIQSENTKDDVSKYDLSIDEVIKDIAGRL